MCFSLVFFLLTTKDSFVRTEGEELHQANKKQRSILEGRYCTFNLVWEPQDAWDRRHPLLNLLPRRSHHRWITDGWIISCSRTFPLLTRPPLVIMAPLIYGPVCSGSPCSQLQLILSLLTQVSSSAQVLHTKVFTSGRYKTQSRYFYMSS